MSASFAALLDAYVREACDPDVSVESERRCEAAFRAVLAAHAEVVEALTKVREQKDGAYAERDRCVALAARMAAVLHWPAWLGRHVGAEWDDDWRNIVFIGLPSGQVSWHIHDSELPLVSFLGRRDEPWDGHDTAEKYRRCDAPWSASGASGGTR